MHSLSRSISHLSLALAVAVALLSTCLAQEVASVDLTKIETRVVLQYSPPAAAELNPTSLALELDRAIVILKRGIKENWETRDQYLVAFEKTPGTDSTGRAVTDAKEYVACVIGSHLRIHQIWDEGLPIEVEVQRTISVLTNLRNEAESESQTAELQLAPCISTPRLVAVSAGVAAGMLETKVDPVYPAEALENHVSGTVVFDATISAEGRVEALRVIRGPTSLRQAALDAVRQWTYRPYLLNNVPVEVETTINIVFAPSR